MRVISFYTKDWRYPKFAKMLEADCKRLNLTYTIEELKSTGSYLKNTCLKPKFILDKLKEFKEPVLWVDVDGSIVKEPTFFYDIDADFAAKLMPETAKRTWHVGTMWFNYNDDVLNFIERWIDNTGNISDESSLEKTWQESPIKGIDIPKDYFRIIRFSERPQGVICHRISNGISKRQELAGAIQRAKDGLF